MYLLHISRRPCAHLWPCMIKTHWLLYADISILIIVENRTERRVSILDSGVGNNRVASFDPVPDREAFTTRPLLHGSAAKGPLVLFYFVIFICHILKAGP